MKPAPFDYVRPNTLSDVHALLGSEGAAARILAGGQSLVPMLSMRLTRPKLVIDIMRLPAMSDIRVEGNDIRVGCGVRQAALMAWPELEKRQPLLAAALPWVGHAQTRSRGTVCGSIAHADPSAEIPLVLLALEGEILLSSAHGQRRVCATDFFTGLMSTAREENELIEAAIVPRRRPGHGYAFREFARRHGDFAIAGAAVAVQFDGDDRIERCAIGLFGLGSTPLRAPAAEQAALGAKSDVAVRDLGQLAMSELVDVPSDLHGSARYRTRVGAAMVERALVDAIGEATSG